jgi:hypothetical protein
MSLFDLNIMHITVLETLHVHEDIASAHRPGNCWDYRLAGCVASESVGDHTRPCRCSTQCTKYSSYTSYRLLQLARYQTRVSKE